MFESFKNIARIMVLAIALAPLTSLASFITTNEVAMNAIFSQASFGTTPISIRFNPAVKLHNQSPNITTQAGLNALFAAAPSASPTVNIFFVDKVDWCNVYNVGFVGCGQINGNKFAVESLVAAGLNGAELLAHELVHNLGLDHVACGTPNDNLMCANNFGSTALTIAQVNQIFLSPLVQTDTNGLRFISITPISVPEPGTALLLALSLILIATLKNRRIATACY